MGVKMENTFVYNIAEVECKAKLITLLRFSIFNAVKK